MRFYIFNTKKDFDKANESIIAELKLNSINDAWDESTLCWAEPKQRLDSKFIMPVCDAVERDYVQEEYEETWFPSLEVVSEVDSNPFVN